MRIHRHRHRAPKLDIPVYRANEAIDVPEVRVITDDADLGVMETAKAIALAQERESDLVEVSPKANPPVCKILNYGAFKYQKEKEVRKQKAQSKEVEVKGVRLTFRIGEHDFNVRKDQALKFLERGDKIKIEMVLRGRERAHRGVAEGVIKKFLEAIKATYPIRIEQPLSMQMGKLTLIVARS
jgi:translation initiation factor IF-3